MNRKTKRLLVFGFLILCSVVMLALGLKYFPFTKVMKMPAGSEQVFVDPLKIRTLSPNTLYFDFELAPGKEMPGGFYKGQAHSGQYSVKAFGQNSFSVAVERTAKEIGVQNLKAVALSAWLYVFPTKKEVKGSMVFTASNELGVNVCWEGIGVVEPEVPQGKWFKVSKYFDLSKVQFKPDYKIQVYFWNNSSTDILIDDYTIVFGGPVDRRGDSAWVDMTKPAGYTPRFNYPPFPVSYLEKESAGSASKVAEISPGDQVVAGNFLNTGNDGLFIIRQDGRPAGYAFCPETRDFRKVTLNNASALAPVQRVNKILKGRFLGSQADQLIVSGEKGWVLAALEPIPNLCKATGALQTRLKVLWKSESPVTSIYAGDFNGDRQAEILVISDNGSWKVMSFDAKANSGGNWKVMAEDDHESVKDWIKGSQEPGISAGRFLPGSSCDLVLTVAKRNGEKTYSYTLMKLNLARMKWDPLYSEKQNHVGKTIGPDTLKPSDLFFTLDQPAGKEAKVYRYNRDWRYDLKEIRFNDTTFRIVSDVDFRGFDKDRNPKYYETLTLVPGYFQSPSAGTFLVIGSVKKERHYESILPDFVQRYALPNQK